MATQIIWDDVDTEPQPTHKEPAQKLVGGGLDFAPTEDLVAELNRRGIVVTPAFTSPTYTFYPTAPTAPYTITTTSAMGQLGPGTLAGTASPLQYQQLVQGLGSAGNLAKNKW